jgi:putative oxidoreductase
VSATSAQLASAAIAFAFAWAALAKLARHERWRRSVEAHRLPRRAETAVVIGVPVAEIGVAAAIVSGATVAGAGLALALLAIFSSALIRARRIAGDRVPCGCFGRLGERDWRVSLARNCGLAVAAAVAVAGGAGVHVLDGVGVPPAGELFPAALSAGGLVLALWTGHATRAAFRR